MFEQKGYKSFLRAGRYWRVLKMTMRSGQAHDIDRHLPANRWPGSLVVVCPACPEPGFNLQPDWKDYLEDPEHWCATNAGRGGGLTDWARYKLMLWLGTDATFKSYLKSKRGDKNDLPLTDGLAFFPTVAEWEKYCEDNDKIEQVGDEQTEALKN